MRKRAVLGMMICSLLAGVTPGKPRSAPPAQVIACPSYWPPGSSSWESLRRTAPEASIAVINWHVTTAYTDAFVRDLQSTGLIVIAYVDTSYMAAGLASVTEIVDRYYEAYPTLDGIFFDQTSSSWTTGSEAYYRQLYNHAKSKSGKRIVVLNFGRQHDEPFMTVCDISLNAETTWSGYRDWPGLSASAWERNYPPKRFWHLIHGCPARRLAAAIDKSKQNNAGYVFVTNVGPDPWGAIPDYWRMQLEEVSGGRSEVRGLFPASAYELSFESAARPHPRAANVRCGEQPVHLGMITLVTSSTACTSRRG